ncbi:efflux transporter outer membrane subunit [Telmatospirillum siberiense]|uniref:RND transporter n=1 Tax=Telmatospirillum siberiense TaxID=382514 RepID=A0A2N3PMV7_9PROT|nr:efflux transporter outer membrane subunit [Telmatospirillum siberiense]PKU21739.1 RND transporter [Telmatospirillum siberiense]
MLRSYAALPIVAVVAALSACTVGPDYQPPRIAAPDTWSEATDGLNQGPDAAPRLARWWTGFRDPELDHLVEEAIAGNHDLRIAAQRILAARADRTIAAAGYYPSLSAQTTAQRAQQSKNLTLPQVRSLSNTFQAGFDASWEIDLFGKTRRTVEAADATLDATTWDRRAVLVSLLGELGTDYSQLRSAQERIRIARQTIAADQDALDLAQQKFANGMGTELDVAQARAELETVRASLPQFETMVAQNAHAIAVLLGREPGALKVELADLPGILPPVPPNLPSSLPSEVVRNRPDIRSAERTLAAANAEIGVAIAQEFPSFTLTPSIGWEAGTMNKLLTSQGLIWGLAGGANLPLFQGGALEANVDKARALAEEDRLSYQHTVLAAFQDVEDSLVALTNEERRQTALRQAVEANRLALQRATELYRSGLGGFINVVNSERNLNTAEDGLAQSALTRVQQSIAFYKALGGGWQSLDQTAEGKAEKGN